MKLGKTLFPAILLFSFAIPLSAYAEETKTSGNVPLDPSDALLKTLGFPSKAESAVFRSLKEAFRQESKDQALYLAFAEKADEEGQTENGKLFRALARAKRSYLDHYAKTIEMLEGTPPVNVAGTPIVKSTAENLQSALEAETQKERTMYPSFLDQPNVDRSSETSKVFQKAKMVAGSQARFLEEVLATDPSKIPVSAYVICSACGYVFLEWAEVDTCPVCGAPKEEFKKLDEA